MLFCYVSSYPGENPLIAAWEKPLEMTGRARWTECEISVLVLLLLLLDEGV